MSIAEMSILLFAGNYDVLFAYLTSHNYDFAYAFDQRTTRLPQTHAAIPSHIPSAACDRRYDKSHAVRPRRNIRQAMQHEISMYAVAQKEDKGLVSRISRIESCPLRSNSTFTHKPLCFVCVCCVFRTRRWRSASTA